MAAPTPSPVKLVRMRAVPASQLPTHADLASLQSGGTCPSLQEFLSSAIEEAESFVTSYLPQKFQVKSQNKRSPPAAAPVELLAHDRQLEPGTPAEAWFARTSIHENAAKEGTAEWREFDKGLRANHSQHEAEYTPDLQDAHKVLDWNEALQEEHGRVREWEDVEMVLMEMVHHIPSPLNNRVFSVAVITAKRAEEFLVVQIPVDTKGITKAKYADGKGSVTPGMYCSVERGQLIDGGAKVKWQMATASDAKGVLPMWMQKLGVPGAVVKDVGLFIGWVAKNRKA